MSFRACSLKQSKPSYQGDLYSGRHWTDNPTMKTTDTISYALLAMVAIKFLADFIRAKPTLAATRGKRR